jgi:hypothetical protein
VAKAISIAQARLPGPAFLISGATRGTSDLTEAVMRFLETWKPGARQLDRARAEGPWQRARPSGRPGAQACPESQGSEAQADAKNRPQQNPPLGGFRLRDYPKT